MEESWIHSILILPDFFHMYYVIKISYNYMVCGISGVVTHGLYLKCFIIVANLFCFYKHKTSVEGCSVICISDTLGLLYMRLLVHFFRTACRKCIFGGGQRLCNAHTFLWRASKKGNPR